MRVPIDTGHLAGVQIERPKRSSMAEIGRRMSPAAMRAVTVPIMPWQRRMLDEQIREAMQRMVPAFRDVQHAARETMRVLSSADRLFDALRLMRDRREAHERQQVLAMQRWARRRGRRKGRS